MVFPSIHAVKDTSLHASDGCHHPLCSVSLQIYFRHGGVSFSLTHYCDFPFIPKMFYLLSSFHHRKNVTVLFARRTDVMPSVPLETKHHPSAVDLLLIKRLISETSKQNLLQFLQHEFVKISKTFAERLIGKHWSANANGSIGSWGRLLHSGAFDG